jgi:hypothetical protein
VFRADLVEFMVKRGSSEAHIQAITGVSVPPANSVPLRASSAL